MQWGVGAVASFRQRNNFRDLENYRCNVLTVLILTLFATVLVVVSKKEKPDYDDSEHPGMEVFAKFRRKDGRPCSNTGNAGEGVCFICSYFQMYLILLWICNCAGSVVAAQPIFSRIGYCFDDVGGLLCFCALTSNASGGIECKLVLQILETQG